jgi:YD repeat-containing protein
MQLSRYFNTFILSFLIFFGASDVIHAQVNLENIIPISPNAAAVARYGEVPVGYFTGIPNISIPIYTIKTKTMALPLSLDYHAGGNKVEAIASWVGLSWNLSNIPSISRAVKNQPDDGSGGYFTTLYNNKTTRDLYNSMNDTNWYEFWQYMQAVYSGVADSEPDIFSYTLNGKSGKFFYNQDTGSFATTTKDNIIINWISAGRFVITDDDGTKYYFNDQETTTNPNVGGAAPVTMTWNITKMVNPQRTDSLIFEYNENTTSSATLNPYIKYLPLQNPVNCAPPVNQETVSFSTQTIKSNLIKKISFEGGYVQFVPQNTERQDFVGGYALESIKVFSTGDSLIKHTKLGYLYKSGGSSGSACPYPMVSNGDRWMMLKTVTDYSVTGGQNMRHSFDYSDSPFPSCRYSPAQDYWGFYNGKSGNSNLLPSINVPYASGPMQIAGADRSVDPNYTQFGILKKINYPTGGYTEFDFENNTSSLGTAPATYTTNVAVLLGEQTPTTNIYTKTFVINNPPDDILNGGNIGGGAYISGRISGLGCDLNGMAQPCAELFVERLETTGEGASINVTSNFSNYYVPNGTYKMTAKFDQSPPMYGSFVYELSWKVREENFGQTGYIGGLRVKEIRNYTSVNSTPVIKKFEYTTEPGGAISSGDVFSNTRQDYSYLVTSGNLENNYCYGQKFLKMMSYNNYPQITHSGSVIGYKTVFQYTNSPTTTGMTCYRFSHERDAEDTSPYPFPSPALFNSSDFRGQLLEETNYAFLRGIYTPVKKTEFVYNREVYFNLAGFGIRTNIELGNESGGFVLPYQVIPTWSGLIKKTEKTYDPLDSTKVVMAATEYEYDPLTNQLVTTNVHDSKQIEIRTTFNYPNHLILTGTAEIARRWLVAVNNITPVLKQEVFKGNTLISKSTVDYKTFATTNLVFPFESKKYFGDQLSEYMIYNAYDSKGMLTGSQKYQGAKTSYKWGYNGQYLIASCVNAAANEFFYQGFDDTGIVGNAHTGSRNSGATYTVSWTRPNTRAYMISYWRFTDGKWKFAEANYTGGTYVLTGGSMYDDIRIQPKDALMTTYTYKTLVGLTSSTDANGQTMYYKYDDFQRLKFVRDQNLNIVKSLDYNYLYQANDGG